MDFWDGWKLSYLTQAFSNQPASLTGMELGKEMASGKTPYSSSYRSASFTEQTLVWEACTPHPLFPSPFNRLISSAGAAQSRKIAI
jgi:hypothetical protein